MEAPPAPHLSTQYMRRKGAKHVYDPPGPPGTLPGMRQGRSQPGIEQEKAGVYDLRGAWAVPALPLAPHTPRRLAPPARTLTTEEKGACLHGQAIAARQMATSEPAPRAD